MKEIVSIHVGQCGNQMGYDFWEGVCQEHSIDSTLECHDPDMIQHNNIYFEEIDGNRWVPRAILVDLEPGVHNSIMSSSLGGLFNPDFVYHEQSGAGNVFASGFYSTGSEIIDEVMEGIRKQAEKCDVMEAFQLTHSIGGGTGSGLGSLILQQIKTEFPDKLMSCYSVVPSKSVSNVVLEPYNAMLALNHLVEDCDSNVIFDNEALYAIAQNQLKIGEISFSTVNKIVKRAMLDTTASLRFGGFNNAGVRKLLTNLCPFPRMHFLTTTLAPLSASGDSVYDVMGPKQIVRELFDSKNSMCMAELSKGKLLTGAAIFRGKVDTSSAESALSSVRRKNSANFVEWIPDSLMSSICDVPCSDYSLSGVMLGNSTSIQTVFKRIDDQFMPMLARKAFMHHYIQEGLDWPEMDEARMNVMDLANEYQQYELANEQADEDYELDEEDVDVRSSKSVRSGYSGVHSTHASSNRG